MAVPQYLIDASKKYDSQVNLLLPGGDILPAAINPGQAPTIDFSKGASGVGFSNEPEFTKLVSDYVTSLGATGQAGVQDRSTPQGSNIANTFEAMGINKSNPDQALADALKATPVQPQGSTALTKPPSAPTQTQVDEEASKLAASLKIKGVSQTDINKTVDAYYKGYGLSTPASFASQNNISGTIISPASLFASADLTRIRTKMDDLTAQIAAGISSISQTQILEDLFTKFGVKEAQDALTSYNQIIYQKEKELRALPDAIRKSMADVGISEAQALRIITKESQKPMEALNDAMKLAGATQDRINQSLTFVRLFADAAMQDKAARIEAMKFQLEQAQGMYKDLKEDQRDAMNLLLNEKKEIFSIAQLAGINGASPEDIKAISEAENQAVALQLAAKWLKKTTTSSTAGSATMEDFRIIYGRAPKDSQEFNQFVESYKEATKINTNEGTTGGERVLANQKAVIDSATKQLDQEKAQSKDKAANPDTYRKFKRDYIAAGGDVDTFYSIFPIEVYIHPNNQVGDLAVDSVY